MKKSVIHNATKIVVDIFFYLGIVCVIGIPFILMNMQMQYTYNYSQLKFMSAALFLSGVCAVYILYNFKRMFKTLTGGNPFVWNNIRCFKHMAVSCAIIALIYILKCFVLFSFATVVIVCVFAIISAALHLRSGSATPTTAI